ncbi:multidrug efflux SMR transporter [Nonomuraea sp. NPDC049784]|uniref:DMT family transporter n=1 Tax=Nonomuraea sp. NPDC049784 TaxID=3154361 RepID=UPI0033F83F67
MAWLLLALAIAIEIACSTALKAASQGGTSGSPAVYTGLALAGVVLSYLLMSSALRLHMEIGTAYAIWSGVGTAAIALIGIVTFGESINAAKTCALIFIIIGVVLLQLAPQTRTTATAITPTPPPRPAVAVVRPHTIADVTAAMTDLAAALSQLARGPRPVEAASAASPHLQVLPRELTRTQGVEVFDQRSVAPVRVPADGRTLPRAVTGDGANSRPSTVPAVLYMHLPIQSQLRPATTRRPFCHLSDRLSPIDNP